MDEAEAIARIRRFAADPSARGLLDDVAVLGDLVLTHDTIAEGVHYRLDDPPDSVGWKLVAVNLSDLAAKGARPAGALLSLSLTGDGDWEEGFLGGVEEACAQFGLPLLGGDTIRLPDGAPRVLGMTALGRVQQTAPPRSGGSAGDGLWVIGTIGDAGAGLDMLDRDARAAGPLVEAYRRPQPLLEAGQAIAPVALAMMDVSDGLLLDCSRLAAASGCGARIDLDAVPLSAAFVDERGPARSERLFAATAGDDYALLAALPAGLDALSLSLPREPRIARIGTLTKDKGLTLFDASGDVPLPERLGYEHHGK